MNEYKLINFSIKEKLQTINVITYCKKNHYVATGKENGLVEIYDASQNYSSLLKIAVSNVNSIDALEFMYFNGKIQLVGVASSLLFVIDINKGCIVQKDILSNNVCGRSVFQCGNMLAVGCDGGCVYLYQYECELTLMTTIRDMEGSIFSLAWSPLYPKFVVAGSIGKVYRVDLISHEVKYWDIGAENLSTEAHVWCARFVSRILVTGDSRGIVTTWDPANFGILSTFKTHEIDVLCLAEGHKCVYVCGAQPVIVTIDLEQAVITNKRYGVEGDVRSMCVTEKHVAAVGTGGAICLFDKEQRTVAAVDKFIKVESDVGQECHYSAMSKSCVLFVYKDRGLEIHDLSLNGATKHHLSTVYAKDKAHIISWSVSDDLRYLAYSTNDETHILRLCFTVDHNDRLRVTIARYHASTSQTGSSSSRIVLGCGMAVTLPPATVARFITNQERLYLVLARNTATSVTTDHNAEIDIYDMTDDSAGPLLSRTILPTPDNHFADVHTITVSEAARAFAFSARNGNMFLYSLEHGSIQAKIVRQTPAGHINPVRVTNMCFNSTGKRLVIIYSNKEIYDISIALQKNSVWSKKFNNFMPYDWLHSCATRQMIAVAPNKFILLIGKKVIAKIEMEKKIPEQQTPLFVMKKKMTESKMHIIKKELYRRSVMLEKKKKVFAILEKMDKPKDLEDVRKKIAKMEAKIQSLRGFDSVTKVKDEDGSGCFTWYNAREHLIGLHYIGATKTLISLSNEREDVSRLFYSKKMFGL